MEIAQTDLAGDVSACGVDLEIGEFDDLEEPARAQLRGGLPAALDDKVAGREAVLQTDILGKHASAVEVLGHAAGDDRHVAHRRALVVEGTVVRGVFKRLYRADRQSVAALVLGHRFADLAVGDPLIDHAGVHPVDIIVIDLQSVVRGEHDVALAQRRGLSRAQLIAAEAQRLFDVGLQSRGVAAAGFIHAVKLDLAPVVTRVDDDLCHRGGIHVRHVDSRRGDEAAADAVGEDLIGIDIRLGALLHASHRAQEIARDRPELRRGGRGRGVAARRIERIGPVADQPRLEEQRTDQLLRLRLRRGRGKLGRGAAEELFSVLFKRLVDRERDMLGFADAVLIELVADEVKLPARADFVPDGPAVGAAFLQQIQNEVFHLTKPRFRLHIGAAVRDLDPFLVTLAAAAGAEELVVAAEHRDRAEQLRHIAGHDDRRDDLAGQRAVADLIAAVDDALDAPVLGVLHA